MSVVVLLAAVAVASAESSSIAIVHPGPVGPSAVPLAIAHEQGLFAKHAINARLVAAGLGRVGVTSETPIGLFGVPVALRQAAQGTDVKLVATVATARVSGHLVAQPAIKTPQDLRGKRFGVSGIGAGLWINTVLALEHLGLDPSRDNIAMVEIGDLAKIAQALEANTIDAAVLAPAQSAQLRAKGFSVLLDLQPANLSGPQPGLVVTGTYLRERPETVEKVLLALVEAVAFTLAPANKATVLQTSMKVFGITDLAAAESGYQSLLRSLIRKPFPTIEPLRAMQRIIAMHNAAVLNVRLEELVDDRLVRKLDESGAIDRLYAAYGVK
jgi:NitT/TauT family transport system substrate-binding protein